MIFCKVKFIHSEKVTKLFEISTLDLFYVVPVKSKVEILQNMNMNSTFTCTKVAN